MTEPRCDGPDGPESLPESDDETVPPVAFNEAYWYDEDHDYRLVSDVSQRYPEPPSGDDQESIKPSIEEADARGDALGVVADDVSPLLATFQFRFVQ